MKGKINLKKLLSAIGLLTIVVPTSLSVVACGSRTIVNKIDLKTIITNIIVEGKETNDEVTVLAKILELNKESGVKSEDVEIKEFKEATIEADGSAKIVAKEESKFTGSVEIKIKSLEQTDLNTKIENQEITTNEESQVVKAVLEANPESGLTDQDIQVKAGSFHAATPGVAGSVIIEAKNNAYKGEVNITIKALAKIELESVLKETIVEGKETNDEVTVLAKILELNKESGVKSEDVEIKEFKEATIEADGSAKIVAKEESKFTGSVEIKITNLKDLDITVVQQWFDGSSQTYFSEPNGLSVKEIKNWVSNHFINNSVFLGNVWNVINRIYPGVKQEMVYNLDNYQLEDKLYLDRECTIEVKDTDLRKDLKFYIKVFGVNQLIGSLVIQFLIL